MIKTVLIQGTSMSLQTTVAAEVYLSARILLKKQTLNKAKSLMYRAGTGKP
jgi:hypothetical protein